LRDPAQPELMQARWDSGDHIHPNDAGYHAMAETIPLTWFGCQAGQGSTPRTKKRGFKPMGTAGE